MNYTQAGTLADRLVELFRDPDDHETREVEIVAPYPTRVEVGVKFYGTVFSRELDLARACCEQTDHPLDFRVELATDANGSAFGMYIMFYEFWRESGAGDVYDVFAIGPDHEYIRQDDAAVRKRELFEDLRQSRKDNDA